MDELTNEQCTSRIVSKQTTFLSSISVKLKEEKTPVPTLQQEVLLLDDKPKIVISNSSNHNSPMERRKPMASDNNNNSGYSGCGGECMNDMEGSKDCLLSKEKISQSLMTKRHSSMNSLSSSNSLDFASDYSDLENDDDTLTSSIENAFKTNMWVKLRKAVRWSPFMQSYKKKDYRWIQLAGHSGGFKAGENGTIMKKSTKREMECLQRLMKDPLKKCVPEYKRNVLEGEDLFIEMQDLLQEFEQPAFVMDCKIGTRTYLEEEVKKNPKPREDLYLKMVSVDPTEPTAAENETCMCTKERYLLWRDQLSSTASLGFRIEGIKRGENNPDKDFKKLKSAEDISGVFERFVENKKDIQAKYVQKLKDIRQVLMSSNFFNSHELIGSSLLFLHDTKGRVGVWLIDFGKTVNLTNGTAIDHKSPWSLGNHEDGYLIGLDNLIQIWSEVGASNS